MKVGDCKQRYALDLSGFCKGGIFRNILTLASGSGLAQVIALCFAPALTRIYTPDAFGTLGVFMALAGIISIVATLRYDVALVLPKSDFDAWALARFTTGCAMLVSIFSSLIFIPFREPIAYALGNPSLSFYLPFLPVVVIFTALTSVGHYWAVRGKFFKGMSGSAVASTLVGNGMKTVLGTGGCGVSGLIFGSIFQVGCHLGLLCGVIRKSTPLQVSHRAKEVARVYSDFPRYRLPQDVMAAAASNLPQILLAVFFSPVVVGYFVLAQRVIQAPVSLVREAVRSVFYQNAAELAESLDELFRRTRNLTLILGFVTLPFFGLIVIVGDVLFGALFGSEWIEAGRYAKYVAILVFAAVCNTPSVVIVPIIGANRGLLLYEIFATSSRLFAVVLGGCLLSAEQTVMLFCLTSACANACLIFWVFNLLNRKRKQEACV